MSKELLQSLKDDLLLIRNIVGESGTTDLKTKINVADLVKEATEQIDSALHNKDTSRKPYNDFLSLGDASDVCATAMNYFKRLGMLLSSLMNTTDKKVVSYTLNDELVGKQLYNEFQELEAEGLMKFSNGKVEYIVAKDKLGNYACATKDNWKVKDKKDE